MCPFLWNTPNGPLPSSLQCSRICVALCQLLKHTVLFTSHFNFYNWKYKVLCIFVIIMRLNLFCPHICFSKTTNNYKINNCHDYATAPLKSSFYHIYTSIWIINHLSWRATCNQSKWQCLSQPTFIDSSVIMHTCSPLLHVVVASGYNSGLFDHNNTAGSKMPQRLYVSMIGFKKKKLLVCVAKITANKPVSCDWCHFIQHIHYLNDRQGRTAAR